MKSRTCAWLEREVLAVLTSAGTPLPDEEISKRIDWTGCPEAIYTNTETFSAGELTNYRKGNVETALARLMAVERVARDYPLYLLAGERPGRTLAWKGLPENKIHLGRMIPPNEFTLTKYLCGLHRRTQFFGVPTVFSIDTAQMCAPKQARMIRTDLRAYRGKVYTETQICGILGWERVREDAEEVLLAEFWENTGDDGHIEYQHAGWLFITQKMYDEASKPRYEGARTGYVVTIDNIAYENEPKDPP